MICSPLSERISLLQANNKQQVIQVSVPKSKTLWQIPQPKPLEVDPCSGRKDWAKKGQHSGQLHVHNPCPWDDCARIQHPGQQPDHSSISITKYHIPVLALHKMPPRYCPSYAIGNWEQSQDWQRSGEPPTGLQSHCRGSDGSVRESGVWTDKSRLGSHKGSFLSRLLAEKEQLHSDSDSFSSQTSFLHQ